MSDQTKIKIEYEDGHTKELWVNEYEVVIPHPDADDDEELRDWLAQHHDDEREGGHGVVLYWEEVASIWSVADDLADLRHRLRDLQPKAHRGIVRKLEETDELMSFAADLIADLEKRVKALTGWQAKVRRQVRGLRGSRDLDNFLKFFK